MKHLRIVTSLGAMALITLGAQAALAASMGSLGVVEYDRFTNTNPTLTADLGGVSGSIADAAVSFNQYNGAATLPAGLPVGYSVSIDRTFVGDNNPATADGLDDRYLFQLDPATMGGAGSVPAAAQLTVAAGPNTGMQNVVFSLFQTDSSGALIGGAIASSATGSLNAMLSSGMEYLLRVVGNLRSDIAATFGIDESTNVGRYDIAFASVVPLPPAVLLFLTALGALFGFGRMRKSNTTA